MLISLIAAMDPNRLIGNGPDIPWQLPADRRHFRDMTVGKPVVMGRKTFETLKRPLGKRLNIILTRNLDYEVPFQTDTLKDRHSTSGELSGCRVAHSVEEVLAIAADAEELMICGGAPIYAAFLPHAHRLYLTRVHATFQGDVYFPAFDLAAWREVKRIDCEPDEKNPYPYSFLFFARQTGAPA